MPGGGREITRQSGWGRHPGQAPSGCGAAGGEDARGVPVAGMLAAGGDGGFAVGRRPGPSCSTATGIAGPAADDDEPVFLPRCQVAEGCGAGVHHTLLVISAVNRPVCRQMQIGVGGRRPGQPNRADAGSRCGGRPGGVAQGGRSASAPLVAASAPATPGPRYRRQPATTGALARPRKNHGVRLCAIITECIIARQGSVSFQVV